MKKIISFSMIIMIALVSFSFVACSNNDNNSKTVERMYISNFEDKSQFYTFGTSLSFGRLEQEKNKNYITDGENSLKIINYGDPSLDMDLDIMYFVGNKYSPKENFTNMDALMFDIFNDNDTDMPCDVRLASKGTKTAESKPYSYTLKPKQWTNIVCEFDRYDTSIDMTKINYIKMSFNNTVMKNNELIKNIYYVDNLYLREAMQVVEPSSNPRVNGEINYFESKADIGVLVSAGANNIKGNPRLELNDDFSMTTQGYSSMKVNISGTKNGSGANSWPTFQMIGASKLGGATDLSKYNYICYDVYNDSDRDFSLQAILRTKLEYYDVPSVTIKKGQWTRVKFKMSNVFDTHQYFDYSIMNGYDMWLYGFDESLTDLVFYVDNWHAEV